MMSSSGMIEFRSLHFCSIRHDWVREMRSRRTLNKSWLTHTDLEEDRKRIIWGEHSDEHLAGGEYLCKLSFNDVKLDLLVDCPGHVVPFKRLWITKKSCVVKQTAEAVLAWLAVEYYAIEVLTFYTYEFVLPLLGGALGQSSGLTDRNHQTVPPARQNESDQLFSSKQTVDDLLRVASVQTSS